MSLLPKSSPVSEIRHPATAEVVFLADAWAKWNYLVQKAPGEISVLGEVHHAGSRFTITNVHLIKQRNSSANTEMLEDAIPQFLSEFIGAGGDTNTLKAWIHSHSSMDVFWSGTDLNNILTLGIHAPYIVSVVTNRREEKRARIDSFRPVHMYLDNIPVTIAYDLPDEICYALDQEMAEKCVGFTERGSVNGTQESLWSDVPPPTQEPDGKAFGSDTGEEDGYDIEAILDDYDPSLSEAVCLALDEESPERFDDAFFIRLQQAITDVLAELKADVDLHRRTRGAYLAAKSELDDWYEQLDQKITRTTMGL